MNDSDNASFKTRRSSLSWIYDIIEHRLQQRIQRGTARQLLYTDEAVSRSHRPRRKETPTTTATDVDHQSVVIPTVTSISTVSIDASACTRMKSMDFSSNDYLGLARDMEQYRRVERAMKQYILLSFRSPNDHEQRNDNDVQHQYANAPLLGSTGSRLLSGDTPLLHDLEDYLCHVHHAQSALLCNSGYDANLSVVSTLPCTCIVHDSYIHNSLHMGIRLWQTPQSVHTTTTTTTGERTSDVPIVEEQIGNAQKAVASFQHNNVHDLRQKLQYFKSRGHTIVVLIESVYSMDGDVAPVREILDLAESYQSLVVVDEAHGFGVFGPTQSVSDNDSTVSSGGTGVLAMTHCEQHPALLSAIYTYGKAAGCHGAVICSPHSKRMKDYWINYAYPIVYSTALPLHSILTIQCSYESITGTKGQRLRSHLWNIIQYFQSQLKQLLDAIKEICNHPYRLLPSSSPIQALIVPGNVECTIFCQSLFRISGGTIRLFPIKTPTVPMGQERIRIVLHAHNSMSQVDALLRCINDTIQEVQMTFTGIPSQPVSKL